MNDGEYETEEKLFNPSGAGGHLLQPQPDGHEEPVAEAHRPDEPAELRSEDAEGNDACS